MKYSEIYDICMPEKKRKEERYNVWVTIAVRPLSILVTKLFVNTNVKPTTITKWSVLSSLIGFFILCFLHSLNWLLVGWFFFFVWAILDGVDGNLARCTKQCSMLGDLWDTMGGYAAMVLMYFAAGVVAYFKPQIELFFDPVIFLILGCATSVISIFPRLVMHKRKSSGINDAAVNAVSDKHKFGLSQIAAMNLVSPSGFMQIIFLIALVFNMLNYFVTLYFIVNTGIMLMSLNKLLK